MDTLVSSQPSGKFVSNHFFQDVLRVVTELSTQTFRSRREQQKSTQEHRATREALKQTTADLEEVAKLANALYETSQRMGVVIDYLLKERAVETGKEVQSFELMLSAVLHQIEMQETEQSDNSNDFGRGGQEGVDETTTAHSAE